MSRLNDERLLELLRAAHEVNNLEAGVHEPLPTRTTLASSFPLRRKLIAISGVAAMVALLAAVWFASYHAAQSNNTQPAVNPPNVTASNTSTNPGAPSDDSEIDADTRKAVVLAIGETDTGELACVNWSADVLQGRTIHQVNDDELKRLGMALMCESPSRRMIVVAMEGPQTAIPTTNQRASEMARCLLKAPACGSSQFDQSRCASAGCLTPEINVRMKSIALK
ncbi:MAG: hypothetical protein IBJ18_07530 [Phycisphaerales bacterium]|nr:hypothetical protein [Phycisphaerales bacterium]